MLVFAVRCAEPRTPLTVVGGQRFVNCRWWRFRGLCELRRGGWRLTGMANVLTRSASPTNKAMTFATTISRQPSVQPQSPARRAIASANLPSVPSCFRIMIRSPMAKSQRMSGQRPQNG